MQIPVRSRDHPRIDSDGFEAANPLERLFLDYAKHLRLYGHVQLADLIEENSSLIRELELSGLASEGACVGPLFMAKQLVLDQRVWNGSTIDGNERLVAPRAELVDCA